MSVKKTWCRYERKNEGYHEKYQSFILFHGVTYFAASHLAFPSQLQVSQSFTFFTNLSYSFLWQTPGSGQRNGGGSSRVQVMKNSNTSKYVTGRVRWDKAALREDNSSFRRKAIAQLPPEPWQRQPVSPRPPTAVCALIALRTRRHCSTHTKQRKRRASADR